jgi:hypothetical protein
MKLNGMYTVVWFYIEVVVIVLALKITWAKKILAVEL